MALSRFQAFHFTRVVRIPVVSCSHFVLDNSLGARFNYSSRVLSAKCFSCTSPPTNYDVEYREMSRGASRSYIYEPLLSPKHIRIFSLFSDPDGPIRCFIKQINITESPTYEALSYVWGSPDKTHHISCANSEHHAGESLEDTKIAITSSLYNALQSLRRFQEQMTGEPIWLWADGVCINQNDTRERGLQVQLMDSIYRRATRVITYIGPCDEDDYEAIQLAQRICDYCNMRPDKLSDSSILRPEQYPELGLPHSDDPRWQNLRSIFQRPWSSRVWIVQESILNDSIVMVIGGLHLPWDTLGRLVDYVRRGKIPAITILDHRVSESRSSQPDHLLMMYNLRKWSRNADGTLRKSLLQLLRNCQSFESSDPRDKIYALLGIANDREELNIVPNYSLSSSEIYINTAARILHADSTLDLLSNCFADNSMLLPSWVPDWSSAPASFICPLLYHTSLIRQGLYQASEGRSSQISFDDNSHTLILDGALVDNISYTSGDLTEEAVDYKWLQHHFNRARQSIRNASEESAAEALWRTLITNVTHKEEEATKDYETHFYAYLHLQHLVASIDKKEDRVMNESLYEMSVNFSLAFARWKSNRSFCTTGNGYLCLAPKHTQIGDVVAILMGGRTPYILRREAGRTILVGEAYIHGLMKGEAFTMDDLKLEQIRLV